jgi:hypothetical protein
MKISTAAAKQIRNFPQQSLTIGVDLGDRPVTVAFWMKRVKSWWRAKFPRAPMR